MLTSQVGFDTYSTLKKAALWSQSSDLHAFADRCLDHWEVQELSSVSSCKAKKAAKKVVANPTKKSGYKENCDKLAEP